MAPPKSNKRVSSYSDDDDGFVASDNDTTDRPAKKARTTTALSKAQLKDTEGNTYWELSRTRRVTVTDFKGKTFVNVREYYEKDGKDLPGKKVRFYTQLMVYGWKGSTRGLWLTLFRGNRVLR